MNQLLIAIISLLFSCTIASAAPGEKWHCQETLDITMGLSHNGVTDICRDSRGYLWFATYDGLNRYNGYTTTIFKNSIDSNILPTNRVRSIVEDARGRIWVGTDNGIAVYDYTRDSFTTLCVGRELVVRDIIISTNGEQVYCISESGGVIEYNMALEEVCRVSYEDDRVVFKCVMLDPQTFLFATSKGLLLLDIKHKQFTTPLNIEINYAYTLTLINQHLALVALDRGVKMVSIERSSEGFVFSTLNSLLMADYTIGNIYVGNNGDVWLGTTSKGAVYLPNMINRPKDRQYILNKNRVSGFYCIDDNDILVATFDAGVINFTKRETHFKTLPTSYIIPLIEWIDVEDVFIKHNAEQGGEIYNLITNSSRKITEQFGCSTLDKSGRLWCFSRGYYIQYPYDCISGKKMSITPLSSNPRVACCDRNGDIWIGCEDNIYRVTIDSLGNVDRLEPLSGHRTFRKEALRRVRLLYPDPADDVVWVGTDTQGLYRIDTKGGGSIDDVAVCNYRISKGCRDSLSSNFVTSILRVPSGQLWVGTEQGGICRVEEQGDKLKFKAYTEQDGLSNNVVKSILADNNSNLWIGTNIGLNMFDLKSERFTIYRSSDGLPFDEFNYTAAVSSSGEMFFTGSNSILHFCADKMPHNETLPQLNFGKLYIYNQEIKPNVEFKDRVVLTQSLHDKSKITLKHDENVLSIGVDLLSIEKSSSLRYSYTLDPINTEWTTVDGSNSSIVLNSLAPGSYTLRVKGLNSFGAETPESVIYIDILPPFWSTATAYIIYALLLFIVIFIVVRVLLYHKALNYRLDYEMQEKENLKIAEAEKLQYFSNISHELKTPLTLITAPLEIMIEKFKLDQNIKTNLKIMQRQAKRMLQLINLAHGIQLKDENVLRMHPTIFVMRDFLADTIADYDFLAEVDEKIFTVEYPDALLKVRADYNMLEMMVNNLLNNAFKYTGKGDQILVSYLADKERLTLTISDTGSGISADDLPHIFKRLYRSAEIENTKVGGTGIGLSFTKHIVEQHGGDISVQSGSQKGTIFTIALPIIIESLDVPDSDHSDSHSERDMIIGLDGTIEQNVIDVDNEFKDSLVYVVDDNSEMRSFLATTLSRHFRVEQFTRAKVCLDRVSEQWPDIIVSDIMMPEMDGDQMCNIIKDSITTSHIPIILLSARNTVDDKISGLKMGADAYVEKPFYPQYLLTRIVSILKGRKQLRDRFLSGIPLTQNNVNSVTERDSLMLKKLYELFETNMDNEEFEIEDNIVDLGLSRSVFFPKIKALTNMSPYELLKQYRLQRAAEMLSSGEYNVNEVCSLTGFKCRTHFSRSFKERYSISPSKFKSISATLDKGVPFSTGNLD